MALANLHLTYTGSMLWSGSPLLCSEMSAGVEMKPLAYDHTYGVRDTAIPGGRKEGSVGGVQQPQKRIFRPSRAIAKGRASGVVSELGCCRSKPIPSVRHLLDDAIDAERRSAKMTFWHTGLQRTVSNANVSNMTISISAGQVATWSAEFDGDGFSEGVGGGQMATCSKLITWDRCAVDFGDIPSELILSFNLQISNPSVPIFTSNTNKFPYPDKIRFGMQQVTGTIIYLTSAGDPSDEGSNDPVLCTFALGASTWGFYAVYEPSASTANTGMYTSSIAFHGMRDGTDGIWIEPVHLNLPCISDL